MNTNESPMSNPVILVVDKKDDALKVKQELDHRYAANYHIACEHSADEGKKRLREFKKDNKKVAIVLAAPQISKDDQQIPKDGQQIPKDGQQISKDGQQISKDDQQISKDDQKISNKMNGI